MSRVRICSMLNTRSISLALLLATMVLASAKPASAVPVHLALPKSEVTTKEAWVSSSFRFKLDARCVPEHALTRCAGYARIWTIKPVAFGIQFTLSRPWRRFTLRQGEERRIAFHLNRAHSLLEAHGKLWVKAELQNKRGSGTKRAVLLRWKPSSK
jgi:hypothetical protein